MAIFESSHIKQQQQKKYKTAFLCTQVDNFIRLILNVMFAPAGFLDLMQVLSCVLLTDFLILVTLSKMDPVQ